MAIPAQRDLEQSSTQLAAWLSTKVGAEAELGEFTGTGATGFSNETIIVDATYRGTVDRLVVRVAPTGYTLFPDAAFDEQRDLLIALAAHTSIPVPEVRWHESDPSILGAPFFVMGFVNGITPPDNPPYSVQGWLKEATAEIQERVWWSTIDSIAEIAAIDHTSLDLPPLLDGLDAQLAYYEAFLESVEKDEELAVARRALEWLVAHKPADDEKVLCWGDARLGNVLVTQTGERLSVLDWEMACLGSPSQDLGWAWFLDRKQYAPGAERLPGFPSKEATIARFEERSGLRVTAFDYYELFAGFRHCVIIGRVAVMFKDHGVIPADSALATENAVTRLTASLLDEKAGS